MIYSKDLISMVHCVSIEGSVQSNKYAIQIHKLWTQSHRVSDFKGDENDRN
jgi:hypothetical protein